MGERRERWKLRTGERKEVQVTLGRQEKEEKGGEKIKKVERLKAKLVQDGTRKRQGNAQEEKKGIVCVSQWLHLAGGKRK